MSFIKKIYQSICRFGRWFNEVTLRDGNPMTTEKPSYTNCKNCNTELTGMFCHRCGQYASPPNDKMRTIFTDYYKNFISFDKKSLPTLCNLIFHPGHIAKEYNNGRQVSYLHPFNLNFFILVVLITIVSIVGTDREVSTYFDKISKEEYFISEVMLSTIENNDEYYNKALESPRDTLTMALSFTVAKEHEKLINIVKTLDVDIDALEVPDTLMVSIPRLLIQDSVIVKSKKDPELYEISTNNSLAKEDTIVNEIGEIWNNLTSFIFSHFPLLMLLTAPCLAFALRVSLKRYKRPMSDHYVFALYYMAFVELVIIAVFFAVVLADVSYLKVRYPMFAILLAYLAIALKNAYGIRNIFRATLAAIFVNITYLISCYALMIIVLVAILSYLLAPTL